MDKESLAKKIDLSSILVMQVFFSNECYMWVSHHRYNCLIQVDVINSTIIKVEPFLKEDIDGFAIHRGVVRYKDRLIFYPNRGNGLNIVNIDTGKQDYIDLSEYTIAEKRCKFSAAFVEGKMLWLVPQDYNQDLLSVDLECSLVTRYNWWRDSLIQQNIEKDSVFLGTIQVGEYLVISIRKRNYFLQCDLKDKMMKKIVLDVNNIEIHKVYLINNLLWCTCYNSENIYVLKRDGTVISRIEIGDKAGKVAPYVAVIQYREKVILVPRCEEFVCVLDCNGKILGKIRLNYYIDLCNENTDSYNWAVNIERNNLVLYPNYDGVIRVVNPERFTVVELRYKGLNMLREYYVTHIVSLIVEKKIGEKCTVREDEIALDVFLFLLTK